MHGDATTLLSPEETNDCAGLLYGSMGCNGGQPSGAWRFFAKQGLPTGGDYEDVGAGTSCKPYSLPTCFHHGDNTLGLAASDNVLFLHACPVGDTLVAVGGR